MLGAGRRHSFEVDWWSLGIALSELLIGHSPFLLRCDEKVDTRDHCIRISTKEPCLAKLQSVEQDTSTVCDFIKKLLIKKPDDRLGMTIICMTFFHGLNVDHNNFKFFNFELGAGQHGYIAVKGHPFFALVIFVRFNRNSPFNILLCLFKQKQITELVSCKTEGL